MIAVNPDFAGNHAPRRSLGERIDRAIFSVFPTWGERRLAARRRYEFRESLAERLRSHFARAWEARVARHAAVQPPSCILMGAVTRIVVQAPRLLRGGSAMPGIAERPIRDTPIAIIDFETTGLVPGKDRVVEVSVLRIDPGSEPKLALDTLVNPVRRVSGTEIHGITDEDVRDAPRFEEIAGDVLDALCDCVVASYNVYFDIRFLRYELGQVGIDGEPPHFCLMYLRPMLNIGPKCRLQEACAHFRIEFASAHVAAHDVFGAANLYEMYRDVMEELGVSTFEDLAALRSYRFSESFANDPLPASSGLGLKPGRRVVSRAERPRPVDPETLAVREYWDALKTVLADLRITQEELDYIRRTRKQLQLPKERIRMLHAHAFSSAIARFIDDEWLDDEETIKLRRLHKCLSVLGWSPGE